ncbi:MAG: hypothetical protein SOH81_07285 [Acetobacter sp.]
MALPLECSRTWIIKGNGAEEIGLYDQCHADFTELAIFSIPTLVARQEAIDPSAKSDLSSGHTFIAVSGEKTKAGCLRQVCLDSIQEILADVMIKPG